MSSNVVYAIVKAGGRQEKVAVGDVVVVDRLAAQAGSTIELTALLLVDGEEAAADAKALAKVKVTAEVDAEQKVARRSTSSSTRTRPATASARVTARS